MPETPAGPDRRQASPLITIGVLLVIAGLFVPRILQRMLAAAAPGEPGAVTLVSVDLLRLCFFVGLAVLIIGLVRSRRRPAG